jgi:hypothetical protein
MKERIVAPEWVVAQRADRELMDNLQGGWGISSAPLLRGASFTDFGQSHMAIPTGDSDAEKAVRLHELVHARVSPSSLPNSLCEQLGVSLNAVRIAEEVRVNLIGRMIGRRTEGVGDTRFLADGSELSVCKNIVERGSWNDAVSMFFTTYHTDVHKKVVRALGKNEDWKKAFRVITKKLRKNVNWQFEKTGMQYWVSYTHPEQFDWVADGKSGRIQRELIPMGFTRFTIPTAMIIDDILTTPPQDFVEEKERVKTNYTGDFVSNDNHWAELRFGITSLTETTGRFIGRRKRPAMTGKYPSRPDRLLTDPERRIFREVTKGGNAVIVFDCSGSMGVSHSTVRNAVEKFAGATIAVYSNSSSSMANAWVVARNGRMISEADFRELPLNSGNGVDAPILRWALKQRRTPKDFVLWVSDGYATGEDDYGDEALIRECAVLSQRNNIVGVDTCEEALDLLADMKRTQQVPRNKYCELITKELTKKENDQWKK